jgi:eukaryotic-like serine/threonine-protein kinase
MLSGKRVHSGKSMGEYLAAAGMEQAKSLAFYAPQLPPQIVGIVDRAVALQQEARWQNAREMQHAIRSLYAPR